MEETTQLERMKINYITLGNKIVCRNDKELLRIEKCSCSQYAVTARLQDRRANYHFLLAMKL